MRTVIQNFTLGRILIIRLSSIGDVARTLPALTSLRRQFPQAHIAWAVEDKSGGLLEGHPHLDEVILLERRDIDRCLRSPLTVHRALFRIGTFAARIFGGEFDVVFDFHGLFKSGMIAGLSNAPVRVGFGRGFVKEFNHVFTNRKINPIDARLARVARNLELIRPFVSPENISEKSVLGLTSSHCYKANSFVKERLGDSRPVVAVHPGTSRRLKQWNPAGFAQVCDMLADKMNAKVLLTWGPGERELAEEIQRRARTRPEVAFATESLLELAALLDICDLMVTVDCGPMHIASLVGTPVVALFGPTDTSVNAPYWSPYRVITGNIACRPCEENCRHAKCMEEINPGKVFKAAVELLRQTAQDDR